MDDLFTCDICSKVFKKKSNLIRHQNKKIPCNKVIESNKCNYCDKEL